MFAPSLYYIPNNFIVLGVHFTADLFQVRTTTKKHKTNGARLPQGWFVQALVFLNNLMCFPYPTADRVKRSRVNSAPARCSDSTWTSRPGGGNYGSRNSRLHSIKRQSQDLKSRSYTVCTWRSLFISYAIFLGMLSPILTYFTCVMDTAMKYSPDLVSLLQENLPR